MHSLPHPEILQNSYNSISQNTTLATHHTVNPIQIILLTHLAKHHNKPDYLTDLLTDYNPSRSQRTANQYKLLTHNCTNLTIKQQFAFSIAAPKLWNSLPTSLRSFSSIPSLKRKLKTYIFYIAYQ